MSPEQIQHWAVKAKLWKMTHFAHTTPEEWETLATFARLVEQHVRADEREACAKVCEEAKNHIGDPVLIGTETHYTAHTVCENLARKIRARGDQHG